MTREILFKSGNVEMWMRKISTLGADREEYQVRSPALGLTGTWHQAFADAEREFREQIALDQGKPSQA
jgi:hypothetical protein